MRTLVMGRFAVGLSGRGMLKWDYRALVFELVCLLFVQQVDYL